MEDKTIVCVDCQQPFVFTGGEQQFYAERGLLELPKRCKPCRGQRRRRLSRRRKGGSDRPESVVQADGAGTQEPVEAAEAPVPANGAPRDRPAPSGPRTFWDERPEWVRQAMLKGSTPAPVVAPASSGSSVQADAEERDAAPPGRSLPAKDEMPSNGESSSEGKRRRRRSRRRRRRGSEEGGPRGLEGSAAGSAAQSDPVS